MRICELEARRFGVWSDVTLPVHPQGMTVFYGPNEAGKSTLMRLIRGVLYGYNERDQRTAGPSPQPMACDASLRLELANQRYHLRRISRPGTRGQLQLDGRDITDDDAFMQHLLSGQSEELFQNVFAIGLNELQELATLNGEDVAKHIYGLSLGPDGERILGAQQTAATERHRLLHDDGDSGHITELLRQLDAVEQELRQTSRPEVQHGQLLTRQHDVTEQIETLKQKQSALQHDLRARRFLRRTWPHWSTQRDLKRQLDALPRHPHVSEKSLRRLDEFDRQLSDLKRRRSALVDESRTLGQRATAIEANAALEEHACEIRALAERAETVRETRNHLQTVARTQDQPPQEFVTVADQLKDICTSEQIARVDTSAARTLSLHRAGSAYRDATRRRVKTVKRYKRMASALQRRQAALKAMSRLLGGQTPKLAREFAEKRLEELERLRTLMQREQMLTEGVALVNDELRELDDRSRLPLFFHAVLWFFGIGGFVLFAAGIYAATQGYDGIVAGGPTAWIIGLCYMLLGLSSLATTWTMQQHFRPNAERVQELLLRKQTLDRDLQAARQEIDQLTRRDAMRPPLAATVARGGDPHDLSADDLLPLIRERIEQLRAAERSQRIIDKLKGSMTKLRPKLQECQRAVSQNRQVWHRALRDAGLSDALSVGRTLRQWPHLLDARRHWDRWQEKRAEIKRLRGEIEAFAADVETLTRDLGEPRRTDADPVRVIDDLARTLEQLSDLRRERSTLRQSSKEKRRKAAEMESEITRLRRERSELLDRCGVQDRDEFVAALKTVARRNELEASLEEVNASLNKLVAEESDLAIVEDDLLRYDPDAADADIQTTRRELEDVDAKLQRLFEELGQLKAGLREAEDDRHVASLRFERTQLRAALKSAIERWHAIRVVEQSVESMREQIERTQQPRTLQIASGYLSQLTCGRYHNLWTRLGSRHLIVDDEEGHSVQIEHLSSGTREQVFLAIRIAMMKQFSENEIELPLILDDVTVNFDQVRTEAAVQTLMDCTRNGQQILMFTCHLHVAHLFQNMGTEPVWLPANDRMKLEHRAG